MAVHHDHDIGRSTRPGDRLVDFDLVLPGGELASLFAIVRSMISMLYS